MEITAVFTSFSPFLGGLSLCFPWWRRCKLQEIRISICWCRTSTYLIQLQGSDQNLVIPFFQSQIQTTLLNQFLPLNKPDWCVFRLNIRGCYICLKYWLISKHKGRFIQDQHPHRIHSPQSASATGLKCTALEKAKLKNFNSITDAITIVFEGMSHPQFVTCITFMVKIVFDC